ncbi:two-component system sensor histidine kinase DesK [Motilibacter rhizosphaerae]|uniref:Two-component system sensor histidine kinase DesK n=1 Tax=Motilibacter rhizosphaerae TaxID=598652 RepID=A0A4Q7NTE8_9ACTN|nr:two-component system sensor histidine kinase DesK [Motilibacter rhizosphaerae]
MSATVPKGPSELHEERRVLGVVMAAVWLVYLQSAYVAAWHAHSTIDKWVSLVALTLFAAGYVTAFTFLRQAFLSSGARSAVRGWTAFGVLAVLALLTLPGAGQQGLSTTVYLAAVGVAWLPGRQRLWAVAGTLGAVLVAQGLEPGWTDEGGDIGGILLASVAVFGITKVIERNAQLREAYEEIARLAVTEERARMSRDLHDILGHSLTVITVKAELAGKLLPVAPERAVSEVADIERLAREALADVRTTISGQRSVTLVTELGGARNALAGAGIDAEVPTAVDEVPGEHREVFGWVVREGVTNVVRHSGARTCTILLTAHSVEVVDDGRGPEDTGGGGQGLRGLRERVQQAGGRLEVGRAGPDGGFRLKVDMLP